MSSCLESMQCNKRYVTYVTEKRKQSRSDVLVGRSCRELDLFIHWRHNYNSDVHTLIDWGEFSNNRWEIFVENTYRPCKINFILKWLFPCDCLMYLCLKHINYVNKINWFELRLFRTQKISSHVTETYVTFGNVCFMGFISRTTCTC